MAEWPRIPHKGDRINASGAALPQGCALGAAFGLGAAMVSTGATRGMARVPSGRTAVIRVTNNRVTLRWGLQVSRGAGLKGG